MSAKDRNPEENERRTSVFSEMAKKAVLAGIGAIFMTEESIRNAFTEMKLPKEAMSFLLDQVKKQKDDLMSSFGSEVSKFLAKVNVHEEVQKALSRLQMHIDAKITFSPKGSPASENFKVSFKLKDGNKS